MMNVIFKLHINTLKPNCDARTFLAHSVLNSTVSPRPIACRVAHFLYFASVRCQLLSEIVTRVFHNTFVPSKHQVRNCKFWMAKINLKNAKICNRNWQFWPEFWQRHTIWHIEGLSSLTACTGKRRSILTTDDDLIDIVYLRSSQEMNETFISVFIDY